MEIAFPRSSPGVTRPPRLLPGLVLWVVALGACSAPPPAALQDGVTVLDLARALPLARQVAAGEADPTHPAEARQHPPEEARGDTVRTAGDTLYLPLGRSVEYFLPLPAGTVLAWDGLEIRGGTAGELRLSLTPENGEDRSLGALPVTGVERAGHVELPTGATSGDLAVGRPWRLTLGAVGGPEASPEAQGFLLHRPRLLAPATESAAAAVEAAAEPPTAPAPLRASDTASPVPVNLVIYMVDTLRKDRLGCYGYPRPTSPAMDAFAAEGMLFEDAVAQSPWTRPSVASVLTGLGPLTHAVHGRKDTLAPEAVTLAEVLRDHGWATAGWVTNGNVARSFGFAQGFQEFRLLSGDDNDSHRVNEKAAEWLARRPRDRPFFLYLHTVDPHSPYLPPEPFRQRFAPTVPRDGTGARWWLKQLKRGEIEPTPEILARLRDLYDGEVAQNDHAFGRLLELLEAEGVAGSTVVVVVSDHGEEFHEHGRWEHGKSLHTEVMDVPLLMRFPEPAPRGVRIAAPVQHTDLMPTLLSYFGLPLPAAMEGRDLTALLAGGELALRPPEILSHLDLDGFRAVSLTTGTWRFIDGRSRVHGQEEELYHRRRDPGEQRNLVSARPVTGGHLGTLLRSREMDLTPALRAGEARLDEELERQLRALGYLP